MKQFIQLYPVVYSNYDFPQNVMHKNVLKVSFNNVITIEYDSVKILFEKCASWRRLERLHVIINIICRGALVDICILKEQIL